MTNHDLRQQLLQLRKRVRQLLALYGVSWLVAVVFGGVFLAGFLDWLIQIDDPGIRLILGCLVLTASAWIAWRLLITPLRRTLSDIDIALRIEKRYPGFRDSFASTVQFLKGECDARVGSPDLQRQVVEQTLRHVRQLRVEELVETRPIRRAVMVAIGVCLVTAVVAGFNQANAATALHRLLFPFSERPWPKKTRLVLLDEQFQTLKTQLEPHRVARGDQLDLYVENERGPLPSDVKLQIRLEPPQPIVAETEPDKIEQNAANDVREETLRTTTRQDENGKSRSVGVVQMRPVEDRLWFRAVGGDDHEMPWHEIEVVPPPQIETLHVTLTPPEYLGEPPVELPPGTGHVRGYLGTRVDITIHANKPLRTARLRVKESPAVEIAINPDDKSTLQTSFVIEEAGVYSYWFELQDYQGFEDADAPRFEVRGIADNSPDVWISQPEVDRQVTPAAVVPFELGAKDDLGLAGLRLVYQIADAGSKSEPVAISLPLSTNDIFRQTAEHNLDLGQLSLQPGQQVVTWAEAEDAFRIDEQRHIGRSLTRTLTIVTPEQKTQEFEDRQSGIVDELADVRETQRQVRDTIEQLQIQMQNAGELRLEDIDQLKRVEMEQKRIGSRLTHPLDGIDARAKDIEDDMQANGIESQPMQRRLARIREELRVIQEDHLPEIERALIDTRKQAETKSATGQSADATQAKQQQKRLNETAGEQDAILKSLGTLLDELSEWRRQRNLSAEIENLLNEQDALNAERADIGQRTLGKNRSQLTPQDRADLSKLANRQRNQAERVEQLETELKENAETLQESRPDIAERLNDARQYLRESATAGALREAARALDENEIGSATKQQSQATENLRELDDILQNRGAANVEELAQELESLRKRLEELKQDQTETLRKLKDAESIKDPDQREQELERLRKEQEELQQRAAELARELRRMQAGRPGSSARRAASRMEEAVQRLTKDDPTAIEEIEEALEDLEQAERELAEEQRAAEEQLAQELLEKIADEINAFVERQQAVIDETNRLETERRERGRLTRGQLVSLRNLAELQTTLADETAELAKKIEAAAVFALAIRGAEQNMRRAVTRLEERKTDRRTIEAEEAARDRFADLVAALEKDEKKPEEQTDDAEQTDQQPNQPQSGGPQTDGIPQLAQLKMLKTMQEDILQRTADLDRKRTDTELDDEQKTELTELTEQQSLLADITRNLTKQVMDAVQADPVKPEPDDNQPEETEEEKPEKSKPKKSQDEELKDLGIDLNLDELGPKKPE